MAITAFISVVLVILTLLLALFHYTTPGRKYWKLKNIPYQEPCPIFGNFGPMFLMRKSYMSVLQCYYYKFHKEKYVGLFLARRPTLMILDLELVKSILSLQFSSFSARLAVLTDTRREPLLRNITNMCGTEWKAMRRVISPTFSSAKMKAMFPLISECAHTLQEVLKTESASEVNVPNLMCRYTTDILGSCAFGVDPGSLKNPDSPFMSMSSRMFKSGSPSLKRYCRVFFPRLHCILNLKTYTDDIEAFITNTISQVLAERREKGVQRPDFLQLLLNEQENAETQFPLTDQLIISNSFIFLLAGLETSSITLSFCLYELAKDKELQDSIRNEILECMERHEGLTYEAVAAMQTVSVTVMETLRMHPPVPMTTRICTAPSRIPDTDLEFNLLDGVVIPIHAIQMDPKHFPDPEKFNPDRFRENTPGGFLAFGDGPRSCPGARFGQLMVSTGIAAILSEYNVEPGPKTSPRVKYDSRSFMLKNEDGIWLKFTKRS